MPNNASDWWNQNKPQGYTGSPDLPVESTDQFLSMNPSASGGLGFLSVPNAGIALRNMAQGLKPVSEEDIDSAILNGVDAEKPKIPVRMSYTPAVDTPKGFEDYYHDPITDFTDKYNTKLTARQEQQFQKWLKTLPKNQRSTRDYDLRGYFLAGLNGDKDIQLYNRKEGQHFLDRYKKPNHPTFSDESQWSGVDGFVGGHWTDWGRGRYTFTPSANHMMDSEELANYFKEVEPNVALVDPRVGNYYSQGGNGFINAARWLNQKLIDTFGNRSTFQDSPNPQVGGLRG